MRHEWLFLSFEALAVPLSGQSLWDIPSQLHVTHEHPRSTRRKKVSERAKLKLHPNAKASAGSRRCFLTGNSRHLFAPADWSSILLHSLLPCVVSMQTDRDVSSRTQRGMRGEKKLLKRKSLLCGTCGFSQKERCVGGNRNM